MDLQTAIEILEYHQKWRLGQREDMIHEPQKLTEALDIVLSEVKKSKKMETLNKNKMSNHVLNINTILHTKDGSKLERIAQIKKLFEEGKIYFDPINHEKSKNLIIGCDFGSGKDESRKHIFYYR